MKFHQRVELIETLLKVSDLERVLPENPGKEKLGKCIWTDFEGNKRCNDFWTKRQADEVFGKFYPYRYENTN